MDADAHAFAEFVTQFLGKYGRWNSPKYLFGESYGTTRSAVLIAELELNRSVDFNGVIMLSQFLNASVDDSSPGVDLPFADRAPHATPRPPGTTRSSAPTSRRTSRRSSRRWSISRSPSTPLALQQGNALPEAERAAIAAKLHRYTGLPIDYLRKARLRVTKEMFEKALQDDADVTTGRLDTRFSGPAMDPLAKEPRLRSVRRGGRLGVCERVQRLRPQGSQVRRGARLPPLSRTSRTGSGSTTGFGGTPGRGD